MPKKPRTVLGISLGHGDSSAALVVDGVLVAAAEEERFTRIKHYAQYPTKAIEYCLRHAKLNPSDVSVVALARRPKNVFWRKFFLGVAHPGLFEAKTKNSQPESLSKMLKASGLKSAKLARVEHHLAHMMSVKYVADTESLALFTFDGLGDFVSAAVGKPSGNTVEILNRVYFPHSLGFFYTAMTQYLGFPHFGDEFKVMGLSSYGQPKYLASLRQLIMEHEPFGFRLNLEAFPILRKPMDFYIEKSQPVVKSFFSSNFLTQVIGVPPRKPHEPMTTAHWNLAKSVQARFEEVANQCLRQVHARAGEGTIGLAGGCAHNSVWVGKIPRNTPYKRVFVAPASNDSGIAVGAAIQCAQTEVSPQGKHWGLLGPSHEDYETDPKWDFDFNVHTKNYPSDAELIKWMVEELSHGKIIGFFNGRMELGPRALGSRSILADPRGPKMKDRLNERVKHREIFRPFAASILAEHQDYWLISPFFSPTMEAVFEMKEACRTKVPAVVHVDGTCRIQSVTRETQPFFYNLIEAFRVKTGVPMLLNTSFNDSEPIVCSERDALNCFSRCDMDHLVIGRKTFSRADSVALTG